MDFRPRNAKGENMAKGRDKRKESKGKKKAPKKPASTG